MASSLDSSLHTSYNINTDYTGTSISPPISPPTTMQHSTSSNQFPNTINTLNNDNTTPLVTNTRLNTAPRKPLYKQPIPWIVTLLSIISIAAIALAAYYGVMYHKQTQSLNSLQNQLHTTCLSTGECMVFHDEFNTNTLNTSTWQHDFTMSGSSNGEFEMYSNSSDNTKIIQDSTGNGILHIIPTYTSDWLDPTTMCTNGYGNLTTGCELNWYRQYGICTDASNYGCLYTSSYGIGGDMLRPIRSARINTMNSFGFKYGRVEVSAQLPRGDWLWPAIWMMPVSDQYGIWPQSGEIDIMESRGNGPAYSAGGYNTFSSTLHYGQSGSNQTVANQYDTKQFVSTNDNTTLTDGFHIYGLKWTADEIYTYIDNDSNRVFTYNFKQQSIYSYGDYAANGASYTGTASAPFDTEFYVIFDLAVGGTNNFFPDQTAVEDNKPWRNNDLAPKYEFWTNRTAGTNWGSTWNTTDDSTHLKIDYIRVYQ